MSTLRKSLLGFGAACLLVCGVSEAGIVVLQNGDVFLGKIRDAETTREALVLHSPNGETGKMRIPLHRVRWYDAAADTLTDAYFEEHADAVLHGERWKAQRDEWARPRPPVELDPAIWVGLGKPRLDAVEDFGDGFSIRKPSGWSASLQNDILVLEAPRAGRSGFVPRIHVFAVTAANERPEAQIEWIHRELAQIAGSGTRFQIVELHRRQSQASGANQKLLTETRTRQRKVLTLRQVCFRSGKTYLFSGYADERDYEWWGPVFEASLETLRLSEDG